MFISWLIVLVAGYFWPNSHQQSAGLPPVIVWTGKYYASGYCYVTGWMGTPEQLLSGDLLQYYAFPFYSDTFRALTIDVDTAAIYVQDIPTVEIPNVPYPANNESIFMKIEATKYIYFLNTLTRPVVLDDLYTLKKEYTLTYGPEISLEVTGFDIERASRLLYWSDATYRRICVYEMKQFKYWIPVITTNLASPQDVVVNSSLLFWSDIGSNPKIEKSDLVGNNRVILVSPQTTTLVRPTTLCIDRTYNRLCWLDAGAGHVGCVEFDGSNIVTFTVTNINRVTSFAILVDYFFFGFKNDSNIRISHMTNKSLMEEITSRSFPGLVSVTDMAVLPPPSEVPTGMCTAASNGGCDQICFGSSESSSVTCRCSSRDGYKLQADGKSCKIDPRISEFLVVSDIGDQSISLVNIVRGNKTKVFQTTNVKPSVIEFDRGGNSLYFADLNSNTIQKVSLTNHIPSQSSVAKVSSSVTSLALNEKNGKLYYSSSSFVLQVDLLDLGFGNPVKSIFSEKPNSRLSLDSIHGILYFTSFQDARSGTTIYSANLDSKSALTAIQITTIPYICTAMAVDFKTSEMFLGDASGNLLILRLTDGSYRNLNFPSGNFTGLSFDDDYVYLADNNDTCLKKVDRLTTAMSCQTIMTFSSPFSVLYPVNTDPIPTISKSAPSTNNDTGTTTTTIVIIIVVSIGGTAIIVAIIITCGCVAFRLMRKKLLEAPTNNPSNHEYERNVDSVSIPEYDVINTLERHRFTNNYVGETPEPMKGNQFGDPGDISCSTPKEQDFESDRIELKRPSIESESGIVNQGFMTMAKSICTQPDDGVYLKTT